MSKDAFLIKDCAFTPVATGYKAETLREFRDRLAVIPADSLYFHFWKQIICPLPGVSFANDFAEWAHVYLRDDFLAERLAMLQPFENLETLRIAALAIVENRLYEQKERAFDVRTEAFHFLTYQMVIFNTAQKACYPRDLLHIIPLMRSGSLFYHFIDARSRHGQDDLTAWLRSCQIECASLTQRIQELTGSFISLPNLQSELSSAVKEFFLN